ncbi:hypothetical protein ABFS82_03G123700 [Erythranthe guttata]|uniref:DUF6821 domain-containing protein n=1 Tax=Erythranthe guttata TaxID=4155 RepID=A0A022Q508_ERYGU|nr:PREDICTED: uncharacterized protein LOC105974391 isoform X1 [Erythranthe guttata]EYU22714.1 hypothetical protein MIMGU_mgv1a010259mg [Erythranthe guttata]|eukprot:XP_012854937.1 PREDICTED: uncharacterized protein LOC105974391 isoform X1 [Erythranthe guttata]
MDIIEAKNDFQDWELLLSNSDSESVPAPVSFTESANSFDEIDSGGGLIQVNYFSLESHNRYLEDPEDDKSALSDNPSWIDPGLEEDPTRYLHKESGEFWSDSGSERSEDRKFSDMGFSQNEKNEQTFEGVAAEIIEDKEGKAEEDLGKFNPGSSGIEVDPAELSDGAENYQADVDGNANLHDESVVLGEEKNGAEIIGSGDKVVSKKSGEIEKRSLVWWKMPIDFLKYCVFRMSPVWTVSVAAAVMGFLILGRRLYKMKKKTRGLEIKVTVDDKKVSQVMSRAARLNEAFSVVKRVPMIRPSYPALGSSNNWPVMSLR